MPPRVLATLKKTDRTKFFSFIKYIFVCCLFAELNFIKHATFVGSRTYRIGCMFR